MRLFHPDANVAPLIGLWRGAQGDGALRSLQLHLHTVVGIGQHRGVGGGGGGQRDLHIQLLPAPVGLGAVLAPEHQLVLLRQKQTQVFQFIVFQRAHPHFRQVPAAAQALVIRALRHLPVKGLHGLPLHLRLYFVRVQTHVLQHLGCGDPSAGGKIEAPPAVIPRGVVVIVAAHHQTDAVAVPVGVPVDLGLWALFALRHLSVRIAFIIHVFCRIHSGKFFVESGGVRAVAHKLRHMDAQLHHADHLAPHRLFKAPLVGDALLLRRLHRCGCGALGSCAGACGGRGGSCAAAAGQQQRRSQNHSSKTFVFHGCLLSLTKPRAHRRMGSARGREISKDQWETFSPTTSAMK